MPDHEDENESPYHVPLPELTGKHGYALQRGEDDDTPLDPGAPVAYVAETIRPRHSSLTIEGMIRGIGEVAYQSAKEGGQAKWIMRGIAAAFILPPVAGMTVWLLERF